jgi:hypothetical protein
MKTARLHRSRPTSGSVLVLGLLLLLALGSLTATLSVLQLRLRQEHARAQEDLRAFCVAEAGLNEARVVLQQEGFAGLGALAYPREIGSGSYAIELVDGRDDRSIDVDRVRLRSVGESGRNPAGVQLMLRHVPTGAYEFAAFGAEGVRLNSNVDIDSFDSGDGAYPDGVDFVNDFGNVGSFEAIAFDSNVSVHGDALVGTDGTFDDDQPGVLVSGDQEACELSEPMPVIAVPSFPTRGTLSTSRPTTLPPGNYHYDALTVGSGKLTIQGPATLVVDAFVLDNNAQLVVDATNGPVQLYATGNYVQRSNSSVTTSTGSARDLAVVITSDNRRSRATVDLRSNAEFTGTIYAPNARLSLASNFTVYGALKAAYIELASNTRIHFDEDLLYDPDAEDLFERVSWRRLSQAEIRAAGGAALP